MTSIIMEILCSLKYSSALLAPIVLEYPHQIKYLYSKLWTLQQKVPIWWCENEWARGNGSLENVSILGSKSLWIMYSSLRNKRRPYVYWFYIFFPGPTALLRIGKIVFFRGFCYKDLRILPDFHTLLLFKALRLFFFPKVSRPYVYSLPYVYSGA